MKIIAHRGASAECPENSMMAFKRAFALGVDAIELDLLLSQDQQVVVCHDDLIRVEGEFHLVRELSCDQLKKIDIGEGERIPTLQKVLDVFAGKVPLFLDLKTAGLVEKIKELLLKKGIEQGIHITSGIQSELVKAAELFPHLTRSVVLGACPLKLELLLDWLKTKEISLYRAHVSREVMEQLKTMGVTVRVYPVNWFQEGEQFAQWGVEAIYTDDPACMQSFRK